MRISIGNSRKDLHWKVRNLSWADLVAKLSETRRTSETVAEYKAMSKDDRSERKDIGGFVGGVIKGGRRQKKNVKSRTLITLDADYATGTSWEDAVMVYDCAMAMYSTHSHQPKAPRLRFVIPLDREVTPEEYEPIARRVAADIGIDQFDVTTYEATRLMYWPSTPTDGEFVFEQQAGDPLCADTVLARYDDWHDASSWPTGSLESTVRKKEAKAQGDPRSKPGIVGIFCRTYDIRSAIETFLADEYSPCLDPGRYTYTKGSTSAGVVIYGDDFAYSHHSTDPAGGQLCNAFDLVRLHKFADLDQDVEPGTAVNKLPSYSAMCDFAREDEAVKSTLVSERLSEAAEAFSGDDPDISWASELDVDKKGNIRLTTVNFVTILEHDPNLAGAFAVNLFNDRPCLMKSTPFAQCKDAVSGEPWTDDMMSSLTVYLEQTYDLYSPARLQIALDTVMGNHTFHPVRDYLNSLTWDGVRRGDRLFVHYLGADDDEYTRTVTRKWLTAAVARVMRPGCKFDNLVVLVGSQGIGKSYLGGRLGRSWFSDTFTTVQGKDAYDQLKGCWIIEIAELSAMKKAEVESVKMFISKQEDTYRGAYRHYSQVNKRQCVFYGTTNDDAFLRDQTGNRRFWPIAVDKEKADYDVFDLTDDEVDQVWAEAVQWYKRGESLYLSSEMSAVAAEKQRAFTEIDPRLAQVEEYLDMPIPENWETLSKTDRRNYIQGFLSVDDTPMVQRETICVNELAYELYGRDELQPWQSKEYTNILRSVRGWRRTGEQLRTAYGRQRVFRRVEHED